MGKYKVTFEQCVTYEVEVEADNEDYAMIMVENQAHDSADEKVLGVQYTQALEVEEVE